MLLASGVAFGSASVLNKTPVTDATASSDATESDSATLANAATSARSHRRMNLCQDFNKVCPCHQCVLGGSLISAAHDANARRWASARARSSALTSVARRRASTTSSPSSARGGGRKRKRCAPAPAGPYLSWTFPPPPPLDAPSSRGMVRRRRGVVFSNLCSSGSLDAAAWPFSLRTFASFLDVSSDVSGRKKPPGARCDRAMRPRSSLATPSTTFAAALTVADVDDAGSVRYAIASSPAGTGAGVHASVSSSFSSFAGGSTRTFGSNLPSASYAAARVPSSPGLLNPNPKPTLAHSHAAPATAAAASGRASASSQPAPSNRAHSVLTITSAGAPSPSRATTTRNAA